MTWHRIYESLKFILLAIILIGATTSICLSFYMASIRIAGADHKSEYTIFDAAELLGTKLPTIVTSPASLAPDEREILYSFGNTLIYLVSIVAVLFSSLAVTAKLAEVEQRVPYEKYYLWYGSVLRGLTIFSHFPGLNSYYERLKESSYKKLAVKKMVHFYRRSDHLIIISGDYSWLFDNPWSDPARDIIMNKLPHNVKLISYKSPEEVANTWRKYAAASEAREIYEAIAFSNEATPHKASVVKINADTTYIHLYREIYRANRRDSVCVFYGDGEAGALVSFVEDELKRLYESATEDPSIKASKEQFVNDASLFH